ncbi:MAG: Crp/Fnr family transcriptional regulator [bacterium]
MYSVIEKVIFLQGIDVFKEVRTEDLAYLAAIAHEVTFLPGCEIYHADDSSDALYLVIDGKVRLHRDEQEISVIGPTEAIGTWALFDKKPRVATATALEETKALKVARDDFYDLLSDHVRIAEALLRFLAQRLRGLLESLNQNM